jgi:diaminopimelate epimerase
MQIPFVKMHGIGNDYVYLDRAGAAPELAEAQLPALAEAIADRHFGVGGDGLVLILPGDEQPLRMRMFNADGSEAEMCGNAIRCVARYAHDNGLVPGPRFSIETMRRAVAMEMLGDGRVCADMGAPMTLDNGAELSAEARRPETLTIDGVDHEFTPVSMGNPHAVVFVDDLDFDVAAVGTRWEHHPRFPQRTNTEFVVPLARDRLRMRVWERGSGETLACGTGACAAAVAAVVTGRTERRVTLHLRGGDLEIHWSPDDNHVYMTGPASYVFSGTFTWDQTTRDHMEQS